MSQKIKTTLFQALPVIIIATLLVVAIIYAWTEPPYGGVCADPPCPPGGNVPAPINVGNTGQAKSGALTIQGGFESTGVTLLATLGGNVGIGTTNPGAELEVAGQVKITGGYPGLEVVGTVLAGTAEAYGFKDRNNTAYFVDPSPTLSTDPSAILAGNVGIGTTGPSGKLDILVAAADATTKPLVIGKGTSNYVTILNNGNVGIGTTTPAYKLDVFGKIRASDDVCTDLAGGKCLSSIGGSQWTTSGNNIYYTAGNVGIGTTGPNNKIQVAGLVNFNDTDYNALLGYQAGSNLPAGAQGNTALGYLALTTANNTNADQNTAVGLYALRYNTSGYYNTAVGSWALQANTSGYFNTAVGQDALRQNTIGYYNTAVGVGALRDNTTGI